MARSSPLGLVACIVGCAAGGAHEDAPKPGSQSFWTRTAAAVRTFAETQVEPEMAAPTTCPETVQELPSSTLFDADDRRLQGRALVVVDKSARRLMLYRRGALADCYTVGLGFTPDGHKQVEGDGKTPEGWYRTSDKPWSMFKNAIAVHYPNRVDAKAAAADGRIRKKTRDAIVRASKGGRVPPQRTAMGGAILIHGGGSSSDWTLGCVALDDDDLVDLRAQLPAGKRTNLLVLP